MTSYYLFYAIVLVNGDSLMNKQETSRADVVRSFFLSTECIHRKALDQESPFFLTSQYFDFYQRVFADNDSDKTFFESSIFRHLVLFDFAQTFTSIVFQLVQTRMVGCMINENRIYDYVLHFMNTHHITRLPALSSIWNYTSALDTEVDQLETMVGVVAFLAREHYPSEMDITDLTFENVQNRLLVHMSHGYHKTIKDKHVLVYSEKSKQRRMIDEDPSLLYERINKVLQDTDLLLVRMLPAFCLKGTYDEENLRPSYLDSIRAILDDIFSFLQCM